MKRNRHSKNPICGIYSIQNKLNGNIYIGQSKDIEYRFKEHIYHSKSNIDRDIRILGKENFDFSILKICEEYELDYLEKYYIEIYNSINQGYNIIKGGQDNIGESNSNSKLTEMDVYNIREDYKNGKSVNSSYFNYKDKISISYFYNLWEGKSWTHIHMDVYDFNRSELKNPIKFIISEKDVMDIRNMYVNMSSSEIYNFYQGKIPLSNIKSILSGDTYKNLPIYSKKNKEWINI